MEKRPIQKHPFETAPKDFIHWATPPFSERIEALELIRHEYSQWKYADQ
jgi:hypothetical protein